MVGEIFLHSILYIIGLLLVCIVFVVLISLHDDGAKNSKIGKIIVDILLLFAMYGSWLVFSFMWLEPHKCFSEYRGVEKDKAKYVEYNIFKSDSIFTYAELPDTIVGTICDFDKHANHIHVNIKCEDGHIINDEIIESTDIKNIKTMKFKVIVEYYPSKKYTLLK